METEREMTERAMNELKFAFKKSLKYIIGLIILIFIILFIYRIFLK